MSESKKSTVIIRAPRLALRDAARGFTVIELVAVIVIVAIIAISLAPKTPTGPALTIMGRAKQLASDIRYVQALSMTNGQRYCLKLTPSSPYSGYSLTTATSNCLTTITHPGNLSQPLSICNGATCMTAPALSNGYLQFDSLGQPYTAPTTLLAGNAVITISDGGSSATVTIVPTTGRVSVP